MDTRPKENQPHNGAGFLLDKACHGMMSPQATYTATSSGDL